MITQYFDINQRLIIQSPGTLAPATSTAWVYGDNYNLAIYLTSQGIIQAISANDTLALMLFQPVATLPENNLAIIGLPSIKTDPAGFQYYFVNVNLKTVPLANLVQVPNQPAQCQFHYIFNPADGERFSSSADIAITVNPDPAEGVTGATPVPPGYPSNPNVFEQIVNKNAVGGYPGLDANAHLNPAQIPTDTTLHVLSGQLSVVSGGAGNPYVAVISASFTIPAENGTVAVTLAIATPDLVANQGLLITDGINSLNAVIVSVSGTALSIKNSGGAAVSGTMAANSHVYMGNRAGLADTVVSGLIPALPTLTPTKEFFRGDGAYQPANYPDLTNIPASFLPSGHANAHLTAGSDPIALATIAAAGLCPPPDNSTIIISGGRLVATVSGGGGPFVATVPASFAIPAAGSTIVVTLAAAAADLTLGASVLLTDGSHLLNGIVTAVSGVSLTIRNTGSINGAITGTMGAGSHVYLGNNADLASNAAPGIVRPDASTITIASGVITAVPTGIGKLARISNRGGTAQVVTANSTVLTLPHQEHDQGGFTGVTANSLVIPGGQTGYYQIGAVVMITPASAPTYYSVILNETVSLGTIDQAFVAPAGTTGLVIRLSTQIQLNAGATLQLQGMVIGGGGNLTMTINGGWAPTLWATRIY